MRLKKIKNLNFFKEKSLNNLLRIFLSSFLVVSIFSIIPIFLNFAEKNLKNEEFTKNSKQIIIRCRCCNWLTNVCRSHVFTCFTT